MTSLFAKVALALALTVGTVIALVGISGLIIFADVDRPDPSSIAREQTLIGAPSQTFAGPNR